jgi:hypothetical protein
MAAYLASVLMAGASFGSAFYLFISIDPATFSLKLWASG